MKTIIRNLWKDGKFTTAIGVGLATLGHSLIGQKPILGELLIAVGGSLIASKDPQTNAPDKYEP